MTASHLAHMGLPTPFCCLTGVPIPKGVERRRNSFFRWNLIFQQARIITESEVKDAITCFVRLLSTLHINLSGPRLLEPPAPPFETPWTLAISFSF